jgi:hypothetical protein
LALKRVRIELARSAEFPDGSTRHGYEFVLPLRDDGSLDEEAWKKAPELCTVHRFWEGEDDKRGQLIRKPRGGWAFSYDPGDEDDEAIHRFADHQWREGEYVSVRERDGSTQTFRVVLIRPAPGFQAANPAGGPAARGPKDKGERR